MIKILAFGASNSKNSINKQLANYVSSQIEDAEITLLDLNDFEMPIYSIDVEKETGIPEAAQRFRNQISTADAIIISFAEHNGHYTVAFKNIFDWMTRIDRNVWFSKPMFLLATAPGPRGARRVLESAVIDMERKNGRITAVFSLPFFRENFSEGVGILDEDLRNAFDEELMKFRFSLAEEKDIANS